MVQKVKSGHVRTSQIRMLIASLLKAQTQKKYERYVHNYDFLRPLVQESEVLFKYINCYALFRRKIMDNAGFLPVTIWYFDGKNDVLGFAMTFGALDGRSRIAAFAGVNAEINKRSPGGMQPSCRRMFPTFNQWALCLSLCGVVFPGPVSRVGRCSLPGQRRSGGRQAKTENATTPEMADGLWKRKRAG